jgi:hypothetical protein
MAQNKDDKKNDRMDSQIGAKTSISVYGTSDKLDDESDTMAKIIRQTATEISNKFGQKTGGDAVIDSFTRIGLTNVFDVTKGSGSKSDNLKIDQLKKLMQENSNSAVQILASEGNRVIDYSNYRSINDNIPECAMALDTYVSNILSPDDFTKTLFTVSYDNDDQKNSELIQSKISDMEDKYELDEKIDKIVADTCELGDCFVAVLPYDTEMTKYLASNGMDNRVSSGVLCENIGSYGTAEKIYHLSTRDQEATVTKTDISGISLEEEAAINSMFVLTDSDGNAIGKDGKPLQENASQNQDSDLSEENIAKMINANVHVVSAMTLLEDRVEAEYNSDITSKDIFAKDDIDIDQNKLGGKNSKKQISRDPQGHLAISGSSIRFLDPERTVELKIDDVCYGYYYIEPGFTPGQNQTAYEAQKGKTYATTTNPLNPSLVPQGSVVNQSDASSSPVSKNLDVSDDKLRLISNVFLKGIGKKLNKKYIESNKQFKDIIFSLLKQRYIIENGISVTYFLPSEVVHFKTKSIYSNIVFFAKLYLANLTNIVLIKLGRGHDKRVFYVNAGLDNNHEQAIAKVVQDVKTKEFKMSNLGSISSLLSLNPGAFDDYYIPVSNGERPVNIETMQGMDQDLNNEFMEFLRKSMIEGTGLPQAVLEANDSLEFARQISAQNANFCRRVIRIQKQLTPDFNTFIRLLFRNEYKYSMDGDDLIKGVDLSKIHVKFQTPGSLNMSNMNEQLVQADQVAEAISKVLVPENMNDPNVAVLESEAKSAIVKELMPQINWDNFEKILDKTKEEHVRKAIEDSGKEKARRKKDGDPNGFGIDPSQMGGNQSF